MSHTKLALLSLVVLPAIASAQADTTRRRDTTRTQRDTVSRTQREARGEVERFSADRRNYGLSSEQAMELQRALSGAGCDAGSADGIVGPKTRRAVDCYRRQRKISGNDLEGVITALNLSFARPDTTAAPAPAKRDTSVMPPVIRQDTSMRRDTSTRRDTSARRDTTRRDTTRRDTTGRRPF
jgi:peptidoglycan hydrolase-like protein with peptidoglycan-binding domain